MAEPMLDIAFAAIARPACLGCARRFASERAQRVALADELGRRRAMNDVGLGWALPDAIPADDDDDDPEFDTSWQASA